MKQNILFNGMLTFALTAVGTQAASWCLTNYPDAIFCDDFDRYCTPIPPAPEACADGSTIDGKKLGQVWVWVAGSSVSIEDFYYTSPPWGGKTPCQDHGMLTHARVDLETRCQNKFGTEYRSVIATDLNPLILEFVLNGQTFNKINYANTYIELSYATSVVPSDYILGPNCSANGCSGDDIQFQMICQQDVPPDGCPPISTAPHVAGIAAGALAYLDKNPCHCTDSSIHSPINGRLVFFDGYKWWTLKQGLFPGGGSGGSPVGDFRLRNRSNYIRLTIKSTMIKVELTCTDPDPDEYSWCEIPRDYLGQFNKLYAGVRSSCRLKAGTWDCATTPAILTGVPNAGVPSYDNVVLRGGLPNAEPGACCFSDLNCSEMRGGDCTVMGGQFRGPGTTCATLACCPFLKPDHDRDGDVDQEDFGWFQSCLSGPGITPTPLPCSCADLDDTGDVEGNDLIRFLNCVSGSNLPAAPDCWK